MISDSNAFKKLNFNNEISKDFQNVFLEQTKLLNLADRFKSTTILDIKLRNLSRFQQYETFQVKRYYISSTKGIIYKLLHKLPNDLRLKVFENRKFWENLKNEWRRSLLSRLPSRNKSLVLVVKIMQNQISKFSHPVKFCLIS